MFPLRRRGLLLPFSLRSIVGQRFKSRILSANEIRRHFIDYFKSTDHNYIRSSPVRPFSDPTLEFVNAGMNQFKNVFLGLRKPPVLRATNSQKCIRIGGKHNDLDVVGHDTYHHTFFEMLGNWSFGNYFKKEACEMAWKLITLPPYSLPAENLYVTYFGGDAKLGLEPDLETRDIWRSIGVSPERILPFGLKENFWEMGLTGPCGPCTEIHYDHAGTALRPHLVNKDQSDLTELWNIVFIQYNREEDGNLTSLQQHFVDTGMGFERLVAILHGKSSNYDSDLFSPLFGEIEKICKIQAYRGKFGAEDELGLDTNYRILADHARMATVAIADNIFPYQSNGLRRVVRKTFRVADSLLPGKSLKLVTALSKAVRSSLESAYPEIGNNGASVDVRSVEKRIGEMKSANKKALNDSAALLTAQYSIRDSVRLPPTDDSPKYDYVRSENGEYSVPTVTSDVIAFIANGRHLESNERLNNGQEIGLILDRTNCWSSSKGDTDIGRIELSEKGQSHGTLTFDCATRIGDHIVHRGVFSCSGEISYGPNLLKTGDIGEFCIADLSFNRKRREVTMRCVTGPLVDAAYNKAEELLEYLRTLGESSSVEELDGAVARAKTQVTDNQVPISYRVELNHLVHNIERIGKSKNLGAKVKSMNDVVADAKNSGLPFLVHYAGENAKLEKLTRTCQDVPVMLFAYNNGHLTARCCTPQVSKS
ncbi:unnamed protein product [Nesidiocoris tenuis]|uniref:alanine--tRNA ligase n=1 Tax=Nesidiocoris tenuis TaxID=355587 RepID=A0A6H5HE66_9HEMI|nr:unnamed protein product [Nesidiocoris tenuis]